MNAAFSQLVENWSAQESWLFSFLVLFVWHKLVSDLSLSFLWSQQELEDSVKVDDVWFVLSEFLVDQTVWISEHLDDESEGVSEWCGQLLNLLADWVIKGWVFVVPVSSVSTADGTNQVSVNCLFVEILDEFWEIVSVVGLELFLFFSLGERVGAFLGSSQTGVDVINQLADLDVQEQGGEFLHVLLLVFQQLDIVLQLVDVVVNSGQKVVLDIKSWDEAVLLEVLGHVGLIPDLEVQYNSVLTHLLDFNEGDDVQGHFQ